MRERSRYRCPPFQAVLLLLLAACTNLSPPPEAVRAPAPTIRPDVPALLALTDHLLALQSITTLQTDFVCQKDIVDFDTPLVSSGTLIAARPDSFRFATLKPYLSEIIQQGGKMLRRTQHETLWDRSDPPPTPTLNTVAGQLAGWSIGNPGRLTEYYAVTWADKPLPPAPEEAEPAQPVDTFILTPTRPDLQKLVKQMTLAYATQSHHLIAAQLATEPGDTMTFWFSQPRIDASLPPDTFTPK